MIRADLGVFAVFLGLGGLFLAPFAGWAAVVVGSVLVLGGGLYVGRYGS